MQDNDKSRIEQLKKNLYSRTPDKLGMRRKQPLSYDHPEVRGEWEREELPALAPEDHGPVSPLLTKIFFGSLAFFVISAAVAAFIIFKGGNTVSSDNLDITVTGPVSVAGGEPIDFEINVKNDNKTTLELVDVGIEFPSGTADPDDISKELKRFRETIGDIPSGSVGTKKVSAVFFGEANSKKEVLITVDYRVEGSNAIFQKEKTYEVFINSSPITLSVDSFDEVNSGESFDITATVVSNSSGVLRNVLLKGAYPFGFTFASSDPKPTFDNNVWRLGDLAPGAKKTVKLTGKIEGQDDERRNFKFDIGIQSATNEKLIGTPFMSAAKGLAISKPFMTLALAVNGDDRGADAVATIGKTVKVDVMWTNNLSVPINNAQITVRVKGDPLDKNTVAVQNGFYRSSDGIITWDRTGVDALESIAPGDSGKVSFSFSTMDRTGTMKNPEVMIDAGVRANRLSEDNVSESIAIAVARSVKLATKAELLAQVFYGSGPFANVGPTPPKAEQETTYTVIWTLTNTSSNIAGATVRAELPSSVRWMGKISPSTEKVSYDEVSGEVVWNAGEVPAYSGFGAPKKEVAFQIAFTPGSNQVGDTPKLLEESYFTGTDRFTGEDVEYQRSELTTKTSPGDSRATDGRVVR